LPDSENYWSTDDAVAMFKNKRKEDFFKSELKFLDQIKNQFSSVLDIGCAGGRLIEVLQDKTDSLSYTGVDFVESSIADGNARYPDAKFLKADALTVDLDEQFDLVYAIGVFQHVADYEKLLARMLAWSRRYLLFDVKLSPSPDPVADLNRSYCSRGEERTHMVLLNWPKFRRHLLSVAELSSVGIWGYETPVNKITHIDEELLPVCSATMLLEKGSGKAPEFNVDLPDWTA